MEHDKFSIVFFFIVNLKSRQKIIAQEKSLNHESHFRVEIAQFFRLLFHKENLSQTLCRNKNKKELERCFATYHKLTLKIVFVSKFQYSCYFFAANLKNYNSINFRECSFSNTSLHKLKII